MRLGVIFCRARADSALFCCTVFACAVLLPREVGAQIDTPRWRATAEVGGLLGGTWLRGTNAPTVSTDPGALIGVGVQRLIGRDVSAGATVRVSAQPVTLHELGRAWSGGTLTESDVLGVLIVESAQGTRLRPSLDLAGGVALMTGASGVLPFRDASRFAPIAEGGVSVRRESDKHQSQEFSLFAHYSVLRFSANALDDASTSGWVRRVMIGLRVVR